MMELIKRLFAPMNIAAYIAWVAIGTEIWLREANGTGVISDAWLHPVVMLLHLLFLVIFIGCTVFEKDRFRTQIMAMSLVLVALAICVVSRFSSAPILLIVACSVIAGLLSPWRLATLFVLSNICLYLIYQHLWNVSNPLVSVFIYSSFQMFAMLMAWYSSQAEKRRDELMLLNTDLIATRTLLAETVRDSERLRLSRELHDVAGHKLTALKLNLTALARQPDLAKHKSIETCAALADELLADIRNVVQQMRLNDGMDLQVAIEKIAAPFPRPNVLLAIDESAHQVPMQQAEVLLRTVQEAITNSARHSQAQQLWVVLQRDAERWHLRIRDDGRMASHWKKGNGLQGMSERLENLGGGLQCERSSTGGMQIEAWLPVAA